MKLPYVALLLVFAILATAWLSWVVANPDAPTAAATATASPDIAPAPEQTAMCIRAIGELSTIEQGLTNSPSASFFQLDDPRLPGFAALLAIVDSPSCAHH